MSSYIALARSDAAAAALENWLMLLKAGNQLPVSSKALPRVVIDHGFAQKSASAAFESVSRHIEAVAAAGGGASFSLNDLVVLVDEVTLSELDATGPDNWNSLVAMLILAFPEIRWVFGRFGIPVKQSKLDDEEQARRDEIVSAHGFIALFSGYRRESLFDASGLRDWVRSRTNKGIGEDLLPYRPRIAAAIDEESSFAYFHAYTAYRFGARADVISTKALMAARFGSEATSSEARKGHGYWLLFEDMSLNFPDRKKDDHWIELSQRAKSFGKLDSSNRDLENSEYRMLVTTGQTLSGDHTLRRNSEYLRKKPLPGRGAIVFKPAKGMFHLWERARLLNRLFPSSPRRGNAPGFDSPKTAAQDTISRSGGAASSSNAHGAPGRLLLIAEHLIERGESLLSLAHSVKQAVVGAVLATDALELIAGRTPTTAFEALSLKHQFEVIAECQFSGVEYHINLTERLREIEDDTERLSRCFARRQRANAASNAYMNICSQLVRLLRTYNQFDEEQECMRRVRRLHNSLWLSQGGWRWAMWIPLRYLELLLGSFSTFVLAVVVWLNVFALAFTFTAGTGSDGLKPVSYGCGLQGALISMFTAGKPEGFVDRECSQLVHLPTTPINRLVPESESEDFGEDAIKWAFSLAAALAMIIGYLHLAVLVTHLYAIINRR